MKFNKKKAKVHLQMFGELIGSTSWQKPILSLLRRGHNYVVHWCMYNHWKARTSISANLARCANNSSEKFEPSLCSWSLPFSFNQRRLTPRRKARIGVDGHLGSTIDMLTYSLMTFISLSAWYLCVASLGVIPYKLGIHKRLEDRARA